MKKPGELSTAELEHKLSHAMSVIDAISTNNPDPQLKKWCVTHLDVINFDWVSVLSSKGIKNDTRRLNG